MEAFDSIAKTYGLAVALLIIAVLCLARVCYKLYAENTYLHGHIEQLLEQRSAAIQGLLDNATKRAS